jgi:hypothetical protein
MNNNAPPFMPRGGYFVGPGGGFHDGAGGPSALQWATFALVLLLVLSYFAMLVSVWSTRRAYANAGGPPPFMGRRRFKRYWTEEAPPPPPEEPPPAA